MPSNQFYYKRFLFALLFLLFLSIKGIAQEEKSISSAIYNFTHYVEWPAENTSGDFIIDVIGHKSVYDKLKEITAGRTVGKQNIVVRFLESVDKITQSHILFVGFWQSKDMAKVIEKVGNAHTLLISEKDGLIDSGSGINFVIRNTLIKFEIKRANIQKYGLSLSKDLEQMAYKAY
jgi:YfiR/HmsC-like